MAGISTSEKLSDIRLRYLFTLMDNRVYDLTKEVYEVYAEMGAELQRRGFSVDIKT